MKGKSAQKTVVRVLDARRNPKKNGIRLRRRKRLDSFSGSRSNAEGCGGGTGERGETSVARSEKKPHKTTGALMCRVH